MKKLLELKIAAQKRVAQCRAEINAAAFAVATTVAGVASAVSIVDYSSIMTSVTAELTAGVGAAAIGIGVLWGARIGTRFVKGLLH